MDCVNPEDGGSILSETLLATNWHGVIFQTNLIFDIYIFYPFSSFPPFFTYSFIPLYFIYSLLRYLSSFLCPNFFMSFLFCLLVSFLLFISTLFLPCFIIFSSVLYLAQYSDYATDRSIEESRFGFY
jgi:hypothetical protein